MLGKEQEKRGKKDKNLRGVIPDTITYIKNKFKSTKRDNFHLITH